jgi:FtsP/CotA-like multicopper oxidase with cupredoxin domain
MKKIEMSIGRILCGLTVLAISQTCLFAQICERFPAGSKVSEPENLYSKDGVLKVDFTYQTSTDSYGFTLYCFVNSDGAQSPTLHVRPGDTLVLTLTNLVPEQPGKVPATMVGMDMSRAGEGGCGAMNMTPSSVNLHYHGTNTAPICHQDEVIHTIINSGQTFRYEVHFPKNEPPGLYWYHPHIHGIATAAVQGGATGAIIVDGIENVNPAVAGLPQRVFVIRDNPAASPVKQPQEAAKYDLSVNYIPVGSPAFIPAELPMKPGEKQFWRIVNSAAVTILDLNLIYDGEQQPLELIALDGVPIGSQDGTGHGKSITEKSILLPPAGRAEFIVTAPSSDVKVARLETIKVDTGPGGDLSYTRPLFRIGTSEAGAAPSDITMVPAVSGPPPAERFAGLADAKPTATRKLYFSENDKYLFITVEGQRPKPYQMDDPPAIVTTQGAVEDWTIENRSPEIHEFHMHQIHFKLLRRNGTRLPERDQYFLDTVNVPYWSGSGPYPSVTLRMDFRGPTVGDFVYHCHILDHEDHGMMAIIRVLPRTEASATTTSGLPAATEAKRGMPER